MKVEFRSVINYWQQVKNAAMNTIGKDVGKIPDSKWKRRILPELASCMVKDCIYRGYCYEYKSCGYFNTPEYKKELEEYRKGINIKL